MLGNQSTIEPQAQASLPFKSHCSYWPWGKGMLKGKEKKGGWAERLGPGLEAVLGKG